MRVARRLAAQRLATLRLATRLRAIRLQALVLLALLLLVLPPPAQAHRQSVSYSSWQVQADGTVTASLRHTPLDLSAARLHPAEPGYTAGVAALMAAGVNVAQGGADCPQQGVASGAPAQGWVVTRMNFACSGGGDLTLRIEAVVAQAPNHVHMARLRSADGAVLTHVFRAQQPEWTVAAGHAAPSGIGGFVLLGVEHILTGWDHLCFLLALVLYARRALQVALLVTGFTVAHSVTLALGVLGFAIPRPPVVEAVIGISILLLAIENGWRRAAAGSAGSAGPLWPLAFVLAAAVLGAFQHVLGLGTVLGLALFAACYFVLAARPDSPPALRLAYTFGFGLFHGFGFAGILGEMALPPESLLGALLGFNLGVELGQLAVLALAWPLLRMVQRRPAWPEAVNAAIAGVAMYWVVTRIAAA